MIASGRLRCGRLPKRPERRQSGAGHHQVDNDALHFDGDAPRPRWVPRILVTGAQTIKPEAYLTIRAARLPEDPELHALSLRSKAHWGYDAVFMAKAAPLLALKPEWYDAGRIIVADLLGTCASLRRPALDRARHRRDASRPSAGEGPIGRCPARHGAVRPFRPLLLRACRRALRRG